MAFSGIIAIVGGKGSGKDTLAEYLATKLSAPHRASSSWLRQRVGAEHLSSQQLREWAIQLYSQLGPAGILDDMVKGLSQPTILSGLRQSEVIAEVKRRGGWVIAVTADPEVRRRRVNSRARAGENYTKSWANSAEYINQFAPDERPGAPDVPATLALADISIDNNGDLAALYAQADALIAQID